tara:strand:- start:2708 stop:3604 length:897 start_codon:yes stop_codon:yes gene_type:complete
MDQSKILITGASGLLGSTLFKLLKNLGAQVEQFDRKNLSWQNHKQNIVLLEKFDIIIHAAANTDVEACEADPFTCYKDNFLLTERLAYAAGHANCKFLYISSSGVYGQTKDKEAYTEYDPVNPTTHHHKAKWMGEQVVSHYVRNSLIVRAGWIFGGMVDNPKNFVARRIEEALKAPNRRIYSNTQQRGVPTFVTDLALKICELLSYDEVGTFNLVNQGNASRFEYVSKIIKLSDLDVIVLPAASETFNRKAKVSNNEMATTLKLEQLGYESLPDWNVSLAAYIEIDLADWLVEKKNDR